MPRDWTKDDYITPEWFLKLVEKVFPEGWIFDPASHNPWLPKRPRWQTTVRDGLEVNWSGQVFVNPPYSKIGPWVDRAVAAGPRDSNIIMLLPANTDTKWFHKLANCDWATPCFWKGRIKFMKPFEEHVPGEDPRYVAPYTRLIEDPSPRHLPLVVFLGNWSKQDDFREVFKDYGSIL